MSSLHLALTRGDVAQYVSSLFTVYIILIFARIVLSWIITFRGSLPYNQPTQVLVGFLESSVDPYLNLFRRFLPPVGLGGMGLDLSPIVGVIVLILAQGIVVGLIN